MMNFKQPQQIFFGLFCLFFAVVGQLSALQADSKKYLKEEIDDIFCGSLGYCLVGEKPIAIEELFASEFRKKYGERLTPSMVTSKLEALFAESKNFTLIVRGNEDFKKIFLIHKQSLEKLLEQEQDILNRRLKEEVTVDSIITAIRGKNTLLDPITFGILLGYSELNSLFYFRRMEVGHYLGKTPSSKTQLFEPKTLQIPEDIFYRKRAPEPSLVFCSFEEEWNWIRSHMVAIEERQSPFRFKPICFIAKRGIETDRIALTFARARKEMAQLFCDRSILECVTQYAQQ